MDPGDLLYPDLAELDEWLATATTATALRVRSPAFPGHALLARLTAADLPALRDLGLDDCKLTADDLATLLDSALLAQLHSLDLADETLDEDALRDLVSSPRLANLVHLRLDVLEVPVHRLVHNPALRRLETLELPTVREPRELAAILTAKFPAARAWRPRVLARALELARDEPFLQRWDDLGTLVAALDATPVPTDIPLDTTAPVPSDTPIVAAPPDPSATHALDAALARWSAATRHALSAWLGAALTGPSPALRRAGNLDLHCLRGVSRKAEDIDVLTSLLAHPDAAHIRRVDLRYLALPEAELTRWLRGPWLANIRALDLLGHTLTAPVLAALVDNPAATGLRALHLSDSVTDPDDLAALLKSPLLARLQALDLSCNALTKTGMALLAAAPLAHLRGLNLRACSLTAAHLAALAPARWPALTHLTLSENNLDDDAARTLAEIPLPALTRLDLGYPRRDPPSFLTDRGAHALAEAVSWASLQDLGLEFHAIGDAGALALATAAQLPALRRLRIAYGNRITATGARALVAAAPARLHLDIEGGCNHHLRAPEILASNLATRPAPDLDDPFDLR